MLILGKKGQIWTKNGPKWAALKFSRTPNLNFLKEHHKISFYTKIAKLNEKFERYKLKC